MLWQANKDTRNPGLFYSIFQDEDDVKSDSSPVRIDIFYIYFLFWGAFESLNAKRGMLNSLVLKGSAHLILISRDQGGSQKL